MLEARRDVDVTHATALDGPLETAVTIHAPEPNQLRDPPVVIFGFPGGGYGRGYYAIEHPGFTGYNQAAHHVANGAIVVACDHLGVGDSSQPDSGELTLERIAAANHATVADVMQALEIGDAVPGLKPVRGARTVGMGQSMGGCLLVVQQGNHATFDAIAVLGFSAIHTVLPTPPGHDGIEDVLVEHGTRGEQPEASVTSDVFHYAFHLDDVPAELVDRDLDGFPMRDPMPMWGSASAPPCVVTMLSPGVITTEAARVEVPVLVAAGERDVVPDPYSEPTAYRASRDVTVYVLTGSAHMHNFARTREVLWNRLDGWMESVLPSS
jgi:pimeloyl-ACP methyl ester carboxylesterase